VHDQVRRSVRARPVAAEQALERFLGPVLGGADQLALAPGRLARRRDQGDRLG
jgi:hypothetical protein